MNSLARNSLIACAVATALGSSAAFAVAPSVTPDYTLYAAGGSAQANAYFTAAAKLLTNVDSYTDATGGADSGSYRILYGTTANAVGTIPAGKNVLYFYKFNGGSFANGIAPQVGSGSTLPYPTVASVLSAGLIGGRTAYASGTDGKPDYAFTDTNLLTNNQIPDWGVADVEVTMFTGYNNPTGNAGGAAQNSNGGAPPTTGATTGIYDNLFGIAVTANLYANKKNFSRAEVEGILAGNISDWSQLFDDNGAQLASGGIIFLDRGEGSGTKASGNQYFLGYPGDGLAAVTPFSANNAYSGTTLTGADSGFTEQSLDIAESSTTNVVNDLLLAQSKGIRAIAVLGLENPPVEHQVGGTNQYDFTKINGIAVDTANGGNDDINGTSTSYINVVKGNYDFYYQNSFNTRAGTLTGSTAGDQFAAAFKNTFTSALFVGADSGVKFPGGVPGTLLDADTQGSLVKGGTIATRNKVSTAPLQQKFPATSAGIPVSKEPL